MAEQVDLLVIGGGINRAGAARDAAGRRLSVLLAERYVARVLMRRVAKDPGLGREVATGVPLVELRHAWSVEDARSARDFLEPGAKLRLFWTARTRAASPAGLPSSQNNL